MKRNIALIPARKGSKGLPGKNFKNFRGKPLIAWTIEAALESRVIDEIVISTNDEAIVEIASKYEVVVEVRPENLSTDETPASEVVRHVLSNRSNFENIFYLQPSSPLRNGEHIKNAFRNFQVRNSAALISVRECQEYPEWMLVADSDGLLSAYSQNSSSRRQEIPKRFYPNGAIYIYKIKELVAAKYVFEKDKAFAFEMDFKSSIDIDTIEDFKLAEILGT